MDFVFGKSIQTRHGNFTSGQPLPAEWNTRETRTQLAEQFGKDVLVPAGEVSNTKMAADLAEIKSDLKMVMDALGLKPGAKKQPGVAKGDA